MAKRISLREYQQGVMDRLQSAAAVAQVDARLGIQIGTENWLVDLGDVAEVMPLPLVAGVPLAHPWFKGIANVRGNLVSVTDLPAFLGLSHPGFNNMSRLILALSLRRPMRHLGWVIAIAMRQGQNGKH